MSDLYWLTDGQMARLKPYFSKSHARPPGDDRRVLSGIIFINRNDLRGRDTPREYGPPKTLHSRWKRWSDKGIFVAMSARRSWSMRPISRLVLNEVEGRTARPPAYR